MSKRLRCSAVSSRIGSPARGCNSRAPPPSAHSAKHDAVMTARLAIRVPGDIRMGFSYVSIQRDDEVCAGV